MIVYKINPHLCFHLSAELEKRKTEWLQEKRALQERLVCAICISVKLEMSTKFSTENEWDKYLLSFQVFNGGK